MEDDMKSAELNAPATKRDLQALSTASKRDLQALSTATKRDLQALSTASKRDLQALAIATKNDIQQLGIAMKRDIADMATKTELAPMKADISTLKADVSTLKTDVSWLRADGESHKAITNRIAGMVVSLQKELKAMRTEFTTKKDFAELKDYIRVALQRMASNDEKTIMNDHILSEHGKTIRSHDARLTKLEGPPKPPLH